VFARFQAGKSSFKSNTDLGFANVQIRKESTEKSGVRIALHHGAYIDVSTDFDAPTLQRVLGMML